MTTLVAFIFILGPLILIHELGHFVMAKLSGVRVEEFGFGWPPLLFKLWQSPSRLTIGATPVVTPRNFELPKIKVGQHVEAVANLTGDTYTLRELRVLDPRIDDVTPRREETGAGTQIRGKLTALDLGTAYTLNWIPLGGFCRMTGEEDPSDPRSLAAQPKRERLAVLMGGSVMNLILAILIFSAAFMTEFREPTKEHVLIFEVVAGSPAERAGLRPRDWILEADGNLVEDANNLVNYIEAHLGQEIVLTLERDDVVPRFECSDFFSFCFPKFTLDHNVTTLELSVLARADPPAGQGPMGIGIDDYPYTYVTRRADSLAKALEMGVEQFVHNMEQLIRLPALVIQGRIDAGEVARPTGPVGISQLASKAIERSSQEDSLFTILHFAGVISMALGITNLLPLPALDGGRILFVLIEALRGRRIDPAKEGLVHLIGLIVLMGLMFIVTIQELLHGTPSVY